MFAAYPRSTSASRRRATPSASLGAPPGARPRSGAPPNQIMTYTHTYCCLARRDLTTAPTRQDKERLARMGLGEKRLIFRGKGVYCCWW